MTSSKFAHNLIPVYSAIVFVVLWEVVGRFVAPQWLPPLSEVAIEALDLIVGGGIGAAWITVTTLGLGLALVIVVAGAVSIVFYTWPTFGRALEPFVNAAMAAPNIALIPAFALIWGFGTETRVVTILAFALAPTILTWTSGLRMAPPHLLEMAHSYGSKFGRSFRTVVVPSAVPMLIGGLRLAIVQGIKGVVAAEMLTGVVGIGRMLIVSATSFAVAELYALVLILVAVSIAAYLVLQAAEVRWRVSV
ncbi:MAG TPA: ABC transporter permease subunit [Terrimesophilobacter sp.]|nr:ABC transporter permease subunit [Terrimesophilobacter sp.]HRP99026.1 ABC transporter permease subunit [Terrimesophilobacter sp.]